MTHYGCQHRRPVHLPEHLEALKHDAYGYPIGNVYSTLYAQYEKLADYVINVSEAIDPTYRHQS